MKRLWILILLTISIILAWCWHQTSTNNKIEDNKIFSVDSCIENWWVVSYSIDPEAGKTSWELQQQLMSWTVEITVVCPKWKQKIWDIKTQSGQIESQICCK